MTSRTDDRRPVGVDAGPRTALLDRDGVESGRSAVAIRSDDPALADALVAAIAPNVSFRLIRPESIRGRSEAADVVILDLRSPGVGLEALAHLQGVATILIAADASQACEAFQRDACDYLVAPVALERLAAALERARLFLVARRPGGLGARPGGVLPPRRYAERIGLRVGRRVVPVAVDEVAWLESQAPFVDVHGVDRSVRVRDCLTRMERLLDPSRFVRVHRGAIVRIDQIAELVRLERGDFDLRLRTGAVTRLSRRRAGRLASLIG